MASILRSLRLIRRTSIWARQQRLTCQLNYGPPQPRFIQTRNFEGKIEQLKKSDQIPQFGNFDQFLAEFPVFAKRNRYSSESLLTQVQSQKHLNSDQAYQLLTCCSYFSHHENVESRKAVIDQIWDHINRSNAPVDASHYNAFMSVCAVHDIEITPTELLEEMAKRKILPTKATFEHLIWFYCRRGDIEIAEKLVQKLKNDHVPPTERIYNALAFGNARIGNLEEAKGQIIKMEEAGLTPPSETYKSLMCGYAANGNIGEIKSLLADCAEQNIQFGSRAILDVIYELSLSGNGDKCDFLFGRLEKKENFNRHASNMIYRLANRRQGEMAYQLLKEMTPSKRNAGVEVKDVHSFVICVKILSSLAEEGKVREVQEIFEELTQQGVTIGNKLLNPLVKVHLANKDFDKAMDVFEEISKKYKATPCRNDLAKRLIQNDDVRNLERLKELSADVHGKKNAMIGLAFAYLECGNVNQAKAIFSRVDRCTLDAQFKAGWEYYLKNGNVEVLERCLEATKRMPNTEGIQVALNEIYLKSGKVPPTSQNAREVEKPMPSFESLEEFLEAFRAGTVNVSGCSYYLQRLCKEFRLDDATQVVLAMSEKGVHPLPLHFDRFIRQLAFAGDVKNLNSIGEHIDETERKLVKFSNRLCHAHIIAGKINEYLQLLETNIDAANSREELTKVKQEFPLGGIFGILASAEPQLLDKFEEIAMKYDKKGLPSPLWCLWQHYFVQENIEQRNRLWTDLLANRKERFFNHILNHSREKRDERFVIRLLDLLKTTPITKKALGLVYSTLISIYSMKGANDTALNAITEASQTVGLDHINPSPLFKVKFALEDEGKQFPFRIPRRVLEE